MNSIHFFVDSKSVDRNLDALTTLMSSAGMSAFLSATIGPYLARRAKERFRSEGDDVTGAWLPLSPATVAIREEQNFGAGPINNRTGELENWVVGSGWSAYPTGLGASMQYPGKEPSGELRKKVQTAQSGKAFPRTPPRPVLGVNEADLIFFQTALSLAVEGAMR